MHGQQVMKEKDLWRQNGDTYIYSGNLYLTGDIHKGIFNLSTGAWTHTQKK